MESFRAAIEWILAKPTSCERNETSALSELLKMTMIDRAELKPTPIKRFLSKMVTEGQPC